jgi:hypothetical protein
MMSLFLFILILSSTVATRRVPPHPSPHRWSAQWEKPPWGAESGIELEPALQIQKQNSLSLHNFTDYGLMTTHMNSGHFLQVSVCRV